MITPKKAQFAKEYIVDLNGTQAAIRAGYSKKTANEQAARLLADVSVRQLIQEAMDKRSEKLDITAERVLQELWNIATADPGALVEFRRTCCRYCHGSQFKYQRTKAEMQKAQSEHKAGKESQKPFDKAGGAGYNATMAPNPKCPECFGQGVGDVFVKDTRHLSPAVRSLFAGVRTTKDGIEVKMHPKDRALEMLGRHLKLFSDKVIVEGGTTVIVKDFTGRKPEADQ